jgi:arylsulfatase A-like enzyme
MTQHGVAARPNIVFFHVDNLGFGELSCYSTGPFRGTATTQIDAFGEGFRLTNYAPEGQCTGPPRKRPGTPLNRIPEFETDR